MKRKFTLLFCMAMAVTLNLLAQDTGSITGRLVDTLMKQPMGSATVLLEKQNDTISTKTVMTKPDGSFAITGLAVPGNYTLRVYFQGYKPVIHNITLTAEEPSYSIAAVYMVMVGNELEAVVVQSTPPITLKGDTTEFRADSYHVKPNSTVEDLLKKIPGIDVDQNGNVKAQGESVSRVYVNGKRFFGDDPKMATQNLPPDVVDKIQVFDALSDQSQFSGFDDGNRVKTINIVTKKNVNTGYFGKVSAGGGHELEKGGSGLYAGGASVNRFNGNQQISFIGQANNTNQQMFTSQDILGSRGGGGRGLGGGQLGGFGGGTSGLTRTFAAGLNYRDNWSTKTQAYGSYFYNNMRTTTGQTSERKNLFSDSTQNTQQNVSSNAVSNNQNHRINFNIESNIDSLNSFIFRPNFSTQNTNNVSSTNTDIFRDVNGSRNYISRTDAATSSHNSGYNGTLDLLLRHRFNKAGRTVSADISWSGNNNSGYGNNFSAVNLVDSNRIDTTNQHYVTDTKGHTIGTTISYTEPIGKFQQLELNYNHTYTESQSNRTTYNFDSLTHDYNELDSLLTNRYENTYNSDRVTLSYHFNNQKINFSLGSGVQFGRQESINRSKGYDITRNYTNMYPTANFRYNISRSQNLRFNYQGRTNQPSVSQLQPVLNNSDPLNQSTGNSNLKQSFTNTFRLQYFSFDRATNKNMFATINLNTISNNIVNMTTRLSNGGQLTQPINLSGNYNLGVYFNYGFPIQSPKSNLNFSTNISTSRTAGLIVDATSAIADTSRNTTRSYSFGETFKWTTNLDSVFDINIFTTPNYTINRYAIQTTSNSNYFSQAIAVEASWYTSSGWILNNAFTYTYYKGLYSTSIPLWNISFSRQIFKNKQGEIKLSVYDLLNENKGVTNSASDNYIQQTTNTILRRYALLTFTYNIRNFGQQGQMPGLFRGGGSRRGPGGGWGGSGGGWNGGRM